MQKRGSHVAGFDLHKTCGERYEVKKKLAHRYLIALSEKTNNPSIAEKMTLKKSSRSLIRP
jgi:adenosine deaminase